jgi:type VI secretion system protein ImpF
MKLTLLDRLTGVDNASGSDKRSHSYARDRLWKESLRRDLSDLLNTRRGETDFKTAFEQSANSILSFGVVDFTSFNLNSDVDQERVRQSIERVIRQFEPRLSGVTVTLEQPEPLHPALKLRIEAISRNGPNMESITIEGTLHRASRNIALSGVKS